jgi:hypothetical protein
MAGPLEPERAGGQRRKRHDDRDRERIGNGPALMIGQVHVGQADEQERRGRQWADRDPVVI